MVQCAMRGDYCFSYWTYDGAEGGNHTGTVRWLAQGRQGQTKLSFGVLVIKVLARMKPICEHVSAGSVVCWLECWPWKAESAQQWWFEPNILSVVSGVTTLRLTNLLEKNSVACIWA